MERVTEESLALECIPLRPIEDGDRLLHDEEDMDTSSDADEDIPLHMDHRRVPCPLWTSVWPTIIASGIVPSLLFYQEQINTVWRIAVSLSDYSALFEEETELTKLALALNAILPQDTKLPETWPFRITKEHTIFPDSIIYRYRPFIEDQECAKYIQSWGPQMPLIIEGCILARELGWRKHETPWNYKAWTRPIIAKCRDIPLMDSTGYEWYIAHGKLMCKELPKQFSSSVGWIPWWKTISNNRNNRLTEDQEDLMLDSD